MEAPIGGVMIFLFTRRAHGEDFHSGFRSVIGDVLNDGKAGTTIGAIDEGIATPPIPGLIKFP
jgi:hypothetical protein